MNQYTHTLVEILGRPGRWRRRFHGSDADGVLPARLIERRPSCFGPPLKLLSGHRPSLVLLGRGPLLALVDGNKLLEVGLERDRGRRRYRGLQEGIRPRRTEPCALGPLRGIRPALRRCRPRRNGSRGSLPPRHWLGCRARPGNRPCRPGNRPCRPGRSGSGRSPWSGSCL